MQRKAPLTKEELEAKKSQVLGLDITESLLEEWATQLPLSEEQMKVLDSISNKILQGRLPELLKEYKDNMNNLAFYAYLACGYKNISTEQMATILEIRSIKNLNPDKFSIEKIDQKTLSDGESSINKYINNLYPVESYSETVARIDSHFLPGLQEASGDAYCIKLSVNLDELKKDPKFLAFLELGQITKSITIAPSLDEPGPHEITWLSVGARNAFNKAVYREHAKDAIFHYGPDIDINKISEGAIQRARYTAASFPGRNDPERFHELKAPVFYMIMHDEFHRQAFSSIPNDVFNAVIRLAGVYRAMAARPWSREIWHLIDMDFDVEKLKFGIYSPDISEQEKTQHFIELLSEKDLDGNPIGLLMPTPYCDTTWMFLVDMVKNENEWSKLGIKAEHLPEPFKSMFEFTAQELKSNPTSNLAELVLKLKCDYLQIPTPDSGEISFSKRVVGKPTFVEVLVDSKPFPYAKADLICLEDATVRELHVNGNREKIMTFINGLPTEKRQDVKMIAAWQSMFEAMRVEPVNQDSVKEFVDFVEKIPDKKLSFFKRHLDSRPLAPVMTLENLKIVNGLPEKFFLILLEHPKMISNFINLCTAMGVNLQEFSKRVDSNLYFEMGNFYKWKEMGKEEDKKNKAQYFALIKGLPLEKQIFLLSHANKLVNTIKTHEELALVLKEQYESLELVLKSTVKLEYFFEQFKITFSELVKKYKNFLQSDFLIAERLSGLFNLCEKGLISLDDLLKIEEGTRLKLYQHSKNVGALCKKIGIKLEEFLELNTRFNNFLLSNQENVNTLLEIADGMAIQSKDGFIQMMNFVKELQEYKENRLADSRDHFSLFSKVAGYDQKTKIAAIDVLFEIMKGKKVNLSNDQLGALRDSRLGQIIDKHQGLLPQAFLRAEIEAKKLAILQTKR